MHKQLSMLVLVLTALAGCRTATHVSYNPERTTHRCAWMAGTWRSVSRTHGALTTSTEHWMPFTAEGSFGVNRTTAEHDRTVFFEFLRIETDEEGTHYIAHPLGRSPGTRFTMIECTGRRAVFENPQHDFPQRIIYERQGDELHARIEGLENGKQRAETWVWERVHD